MLKIVVAMSLAMDIIHAIIRWILASSITRNVKSFMHILISTCRVIILTVMFSSVMTTPTCMPFFEYSESKTYHDLLNKRWSHSVSSFIILIPPAVQNTFSSAIWMAINCSSPLTISKIIIFSIIIIFCVNVFAGHIGETSQKLKHVRGARTPKFVKGWSRFTQEIWCAPLQTSNAWTKIISRRKSKMSLFTGTLRLLLMFS